jgi:hypothetical protein
MIFYYTSYNNILVPIILISILLTTLNTSFIFSQSNSNLLTFEDPMLGIKFQHTGEWVKEGSSLFGAEAECSSLPCMKLPEISISVYPIVTEDFSLENYTQEQISYHNTSQGYTPIALNETNIGEKKAFQYAYSKKSPLLMEEASTEVINYEIYTTEGINLYKISFLANVDEQLSKYLNSFKKMIKTLEIIR